MGGALIAVSILGGSARRGNAACWGICFCGTGGLNERNGGCGRETGLDACSNSPSTLTSWLTLPRFGAFCVSSFGGGAYSGVTLCRLEEIWVRSRGWGVSKLPIANPQP